MLYGIVSTHFRRKACAAAAVPKDSRGDDPRPMTNALSATAEASDGAPFLLGILWASLIVYDALQAAVTVVTLSAQIVRHYKQPFHGQSAATTPKPLPIQMTWMSSSMRIKCILSQANWITIGGVTIKLWCCGDLLWLSLVRHESPPAMKADCSFLLCCRESL